MQSIHETFSIGEKNPTRQRKKKKNQTKTIIIKIVLKNLLKHSAIFIIS